MTPTDTTPARGGGLPRLAMAAAATLFAAGALGFAAAAAQLVWPDLLGHLAPLSFGRLLGVSTGLLLAWLLVAAYAAAWWVVPRTGAGDPDPRPMGAGFALVLIGALIGPASVAIGMGEAARYLEGPWYGEAAVAAGLLLGAAAITRAVLSSDDLPMPVWYLLGALWWGFAAAAVGAVPGLEGIPAALQARFAATVLTGLVPVAAGLGAAYYLIARLVPGASFHPRLGPIGFWSLGFAWMWLAPAGLQHGPTPGWLETVPVVFAFGLVVAALAVLADLAHAARGRWADVSGSRPLQMVLLGVLPFVVLVGQTLVTALRGPSAVVHFTDWETASDVLLFLGAATLWLGALAAHAVPGERGWNRRLGAAHLWATAVGMIVALTGLWVAGLQQGYAWVGSVNDQIVPAGDAFATSVEPLQAMRITAAAGLALLALGAVAFLAAAAVGTTSRSGAGDGAPSFGATGSGAREVLAGAVAVFVIAGASVFALPALDARGDAPASGPGALAEAGREIYAAEGCWQCHTQQVRAVVTDVGLGRVSVPGDYAGDPGDLLGARRIGPDLAHVAGRGWDFASLRSHLSDPRLDRPWSVMPSYGYLDDADLDALAAYLAGLE
ncbi:MAG: cbb3-type cytochrome c oxidase subunit II [Actinobacteria bacterium]|nr:cbb3-type cytochrome c oxidase subunit II [Actinomycetota bacterium]